MSEARRPQTLLELANSLSIRCATAQEFLESRGIAGYTPDSPLPAPVISVSAGSSPV